MILAALQVTEAGNERFLVSAGGYRKTEIAALRRGREVEVDEAVEHQVESSKARRLLHFTPRSKRDTFYDTVAFLTECLHLQNLA